MTEVFAGRWLMVPEMSRLGSSPPQKWVLTIAGEGDWIAVDEEIESPHSGVERVHLAGTVDGSDSPVSGSEVVETIAYRQVDDHTLNGIGKRGGVVRLAMTLSVDEGLGLLVQVFQLLEGGNAVMEGRVVFVREPVEED